MKFWACITSMNERLDRNGGCGIPAFYYGESEWSSRVASCSVGTGASMRNVECYSVQIQRNAQFDGKVRWVLRQKTT